MVNYTNGKKPKGENIQVNKETGLKTGKELANLDTNVPVDTTRPETVQGQTGDWKERYLRLAADLDNAKKRLARHYAQIADQEKEQMLADFLEVADSLERADAFASDASDSLLEGIIITRQQLLAVFDKYDVRPIEAQGKSFDPELHEAIDVVTETGISPNTVVHVEQRGYTIGDKVLRPARVIVNGE